MSRRWPVGLPTVGSPRFQALPWPDTIPVLTAKDLCRGVPEERGSSRSLLAWMESTFGRRNGDGALLHTPTEAIVYHLLLATIEERCGDVSSIYEFNDDTKIPLAIVAEVWNAVMEVLGYEIPRAPSSRKKGK